jgi:hypothetical protein
MQISIDDAGSDRHDVPLLCERIGIDLPLAFR